ncbi:MAG: tRNA preQ1(34) S-adenosylmethionine ribosyltransferase-isomerase QueA, partial [Bacteroidota bacterium]
VGNKLYFSDEEDNDILIAEVVDNTTSRGRTIRFLYDGTDEEFQGLLGSLGHTPLPKYITREAEAIDRERYQTLYAKEMGAVAAPTAGLHFSRELLKRLEIKGVNFSELTLHVGLGTFRSIDVEDLSKHKMDAEYFRVTEDSVNKVNTALNNRRQVCAVGTTTMRSIESSVSAEGLLKQAEGWTNKFIYPPYDFHIATSMITNFHLSKSSLLIMACAFGGYDLIMEAYQQAIKEEYRFFSYGDAMLIL